MALIDIDRDPSPRKLRSFGILLGVFLALLGGLVWRRGGGLAPAGALWGAAVLLPALYFRVPGLRWPLYVAWTSAVYPIGWVISHLLLAVIFYGLVTPFGLLMRLVGHDPMHRKRDPGAQTYWKKLDLGSDRSRYFRQS